LGVKDKLVLDDVGVDDIVIHRHVHRSRELKTVVQKLCRRSSITRTRSRLVGTEFQAQGVVNSDVSVILSELDIDVCETSINPQWNVGANFLLENLNVLLDGCSVKESWLIDVPELVPLLIVELEMSDWRLSDLVKST